MGVLNFVTTKINFRKKKTKRNNKNKLLIELDIENGFEVEEMKLKICTTF